MANQGKVLPAVTDITLDDCMLQWDKMSGIEDWYENHFYMMVGEMGDYDFLLNTCFVVFKGPKGGGLKMVEDGVRNGWTLIMLPKTSRGKMLDNDYITDGSSPWQFLKGEELKVIREEDRVIWKMPGKEFVARPPYWDVRGSFKGIEVDLAMHSICPGIWYLGKFEDIAQNMFGGVDEYVQAKGTITVDGTKYEISNAGGLCEHVAIPGMDQVSSISKGRYLWMMGWSEDIQVHVFYMPGINNYSGKVLVDGKAIAFQGPQQVLVDERETWADPRSHMVTASKWQVRLISDEGELDVVVDNGGRAFIVNTFTNGFLGRLINLAFMNGAFTFADGRTIPLENVKMGIERCFIFKNL